MNNDAFKYAFRSIIRYQNGEHEKGYELAEASAKLDERSKNSYYKIRDVVPDEVIDNIYSVIA